MREQRAPQVRRFDAVVLGSGIAGLSCALALASRGRSVALVAKDGLGDSTSSYAQGGIAAALAGSGDSPEDHFEDTVAAGAGLCDRAATRVLVEGGARAVARLIERGARFDRDEAGELERAREGGHRVGRVVHAGGAATGAEVVRALTEAARKGALSLFEDTFALELLVSSQRCRGVRVLGANEELLELVAHDVVLATGGAGRLFAVTTNPPGATGDGIALALNAGVPVADLEFVQFHPTALAVDASPRPLLSEALRGEGAVLVNRGGRRFVDELLPRDQVSRAIARTCAAESSEHVFLDARGIEGFATRFPSLSEALGLAGLDATRDLLPVAPAAHYLCGGVLTDLHGATALPGLWAIGEAACTGVHGANRLASNSLLEGAVFGERVAEAIATGTSGPDASGALGPLVAGAGDALELRVLAPAPLMPANAPGGLERVGGARPDRSLVDAARRALCRAASRDVGVERDPEGLSRLAGELDATAVALSCSAASSRRDLVELRGLITLARCLVGSAQAREESRGTHYRSDHGARDDARFAARLLHVASPYRELFYGNDDIDPTEQRHKERE